MKCKTLTIREVSLRYGVSADVVRDWLASGELRGLNLGRRGDAKRRSWRVTEDALIEFEALRTQAPPAPAPARKARRRQQPLDVIAYYR